MTRLHLKLSQISLALAFGALVFTACGADTSKAPQIVMNRGDIYAISQDDDTIIKGVTISGRNGKCEKQAAKNLGGYKDMEACVKKCNAIDMPLQERYCRNEACEPMFDGQKLPYNYKQLVYTADEKCPPKNGVWRVELDTNFGTYAYELKDN